jgi:2-methylisocitrate lyase-like PEP mutase family enzyme
MVSIQLRADEHLRAMARALRDLPDEDLNSGISRAAAYEAAGIPSEQIPAHDASALEIERTRRRVTVGNPIPTSCTTTEDWRL